MAATRGDVDVDDGRCLRVRSGCLGIIPFDGKLITFCLAARPGSIWAVCGTTANKINSG